MDNWLIKNKYNELKEALLKKILVTGGCGFIGSHLVEHFVEIGYEVICFDRYNSDGYLYNLNNSKYKKEIEFYLGDIRDYDSLKKAAINASAIIHLAALVSIPYSYLSPLAYVKTNIEGTYNVLEVAKDNDIEDTIITSTSEIYGTAQYTPMDENHPINGQSPYAASKIAADQLSLSYYRSYNIPIKIIRPFNNFGPRQSNRAVIPSIILDVISNNKEEIILGNINTKRDFLYVKDTVLAFTKLIELKSHYGEVFNFGSGYSYEISNVVDEIQKINNSNKSIKISDQKLRPNNSEVFDLVADFKKSKKILKWYPKYSFKDGLLETNDWYLNNQDDFFINSYHI